MCGAKKGRWRTELSLTMFSSAAHLFTDLFILRCHLRSLEQGILRGDANAGESKDLVAFLLQEGYSRGIYREGAVVKDASLNPDSKRTTSILWVNSSQATTANMLSLSETSSLSTSSFRY